MEQKFHRQETKFHRQETKVSQVRNKSLTGVEMMADQ